MSGLLRRYGTSLLVGGAGIALCVLGPGPVELWRVAVIAGLAALLLITDARQEA